METMVELDLAVPQGTEVVVEVVPVKLDKMEIQKVDLEVMAFN